MDAWKKTLTNFTGKTIKSVTIGAINGYDYMTIDTTDDQTVTIYQDGQAGWCNIVGTGIEDGRMLDLPEANL